MLMSFSGFNYDLDTLNTEKPPNELSAAFQEIFKSPPRLNFGELLKNLFPVLRRIVSGVQSFAMMERVGRVLTVMQPSERVKKIEDARETMQRIGMQLLQQKKAEIMREHSEKSTSALERKDVQGRDLLTLLIKANMATDIPDDQRLTDEEVVARASRPLILSQLRTHPHAQRFPPSSSQATRQRARLRRGASTRSASLQKYNRSSARSS